MSSYQNGDDKYGDKYGDIEGAQAGMSEATRTAHDNINNVLQSPQDMSCNESCTACGKDYKGHSRGMLYSALRNRYLFSNVVYLIYTIIIVYINQVAYPYAETLYPVFSDDDSSTGTGTGTTGTGSGGNSTSTSSGPEFAAYNEAIENTNNLFIAAAVIHLVNAFMYIWTWLPFGYTFFSVVMIPEYLNIIGASLYLYTANQYGETDGTYTDDITFRVHYIETAAASIELVAAFGWATTWYLTFPRRTVGRGWTLDDPDSWSNIFIVVPSIYYIAYNIQILMDPADYCCNDVYKTGDNLYLAGAVFYVVAALRDDGLFRCLPAGGVCSYGCDARTPLDPLGNENAYPSKSARPLRQA